MDIIRQLIYRAFLLFSLLFGIPFIAFCVFIGFFLPEDKRFLTGQDLSIAFECIKDIFTKEDL